MIIDIPFFAEVMALLPRKVNKRRFYVRMSHPVEIPELTDQDAPLVALLPYRDWADNKLEETQAVRHSDGGFWREVVRDRRKDGQEVHLPISQFIEVLNGRAWDDSVRPFTTLDSWQFKEAVSDILDIGARKIVSTDVEKQKQQIEENASQYMILDGRLYERCSEPVYKGSFHRDGSYVEYEFVGSYDSRYYQDLWRADDYQRMAAYYDRDRGFPPPKPMVVYRPDLLSWDRERHVFERDMRRAFGYFKDKVKDVSKEVFSPYADLRDLLGQFEDEEHLDEETLLEAGDLVERLHGLLAAQNTGSHEVEFTNVVKLLRAWRERMAERVAVNEIATGMSI